MSATTKSLPLSEIASQTRIPSSILINRVVKFSRLHRHSWGCTWQAGDIKPKRNNPTQHDNGLNRHVTELKTLNLCWIICLQKHTCYSLLINILPVLVGYWSFSGWSGMAACGCVARWWTGGSVRACVCVCVWENWRICWDRWTDGWMNGWKDWWTDWWT